MPTCRNKEQGKGTNEKKNILARIMDKLDKKLESKAKDAGCCDNSDKGKGRSCC